MAKLVRWGGDWLFYGAMLAIIVGAIACNALLSDNYATRCHAAGGIPALNSAYARLCVGEDGRILPIE